MKNKSAISAADKIYNEFILKFGFPCRFHHDQGKEFDNSLFKRLNQLTGIASSRTTPYHPMGDGQCERMNRTLIAMLKTLGEKEKLRWKDHLSKLAFAYNCTVHKTTGYSPHFLMFGREVRLPIDHAFNTGADEQRKMQKSYAKYVSEWEKSMTEAFSIVKRHAEKSGEGNRKYYNKKARGVDVNVGDHVLLRNHNEKGGTGKLRDFWEKTIYIVEQKDPDVPVYTIRPEGGKKKCKRVHKNNIMSCNDILPEVTEDTTVKRTKTSHHEKGRNMVPDVTSTEEENDSDSDEEFVVVGDDTLVEQDNIEEEQEVPDSPDEEQADEQSQGEASDETTGSDESNDPRSRPQRNRRPPAIFTYDNIGGDPVSRYR